MNRTRPALTEVITTLAEANEALDRLRHRFGIDKPPVRSRTTFSATPCSVK